jgi:hypothetical protein
VQVGTSHQILVKKRTRDGWVLNSLGAIRNKLQYLVLSYSTPQQSIYLGLFQYCFSIALKKGASDGWLLNSLGAIYEYVTKFGAILLVHSIVIYPSCK